MILRAAPGFRGVTTSLEHRHIGTWSRLRLRDRLRVRVRTIGVFLIAMLAALPLAAAAADETRFVPWSGETPPGLVLDSLSGETVGLARADGRPVLLHFFATWCEPCRTELVALQDFAARHADRIAVRAIDVGEVDMRVRRFVTSIGWTGPVLLDRDRAAAKAWGVSALPTTIALDGAAIPRLVAEGDLDWSNPRIGAPLDALLSAAAAAGP